MTSPEDHQTTAPTTLTVKALMERLGATRIPTKNPEAPGPEAEVLGIQYRSNEVEAGSVFCCIPGFKRDGHDFAQDAAERGAVALLISHEIADPGVDCYVVKDARKAMARAAVEFYDHPSEKMKMVGVTGTNGKTTTVTLVSWIAQHADMTAGTVGTLGAFFRGAFVHTENTTPESVDYQALLAQGVDQGCDLIASEVSSHALALDRVWGTTYDVVAFTNLTQDHLDYHPDMNDYFNAKAKLFLEYPSQMRVICIDDTWGVKLADKCGAAGLPYHTVSSKLNNTAADLYPTKAEHTHKGTHLEVVTPEGTKVFDVPLIGSFNVQNIMVALGIGVSLGLTYEQVINALSCAPQVPGRLERVGAEYDRAVYVDYAHTPDALEKAMEAVRETNPKRLIVVFGCGGDRDTTKRAPMGRVAAHADLVICTSDNPRTEDPLSIIEMIKKGLIPECEITGAYHEIEPDRIKAIYRAIELANQGDAVLIAGKGHEDYQIIGTVKYHMDDREIASDALITHGMFLS